MASVFEKKLVRAGESRSFHIDYRPDSGWESFEHLGPNVAERRHYTDWHRVERTLARFTRDIAQLHREGWLDRDAHDD